jgi:hypothetical protein
MSSTAKNFRLSNVVWNRRLFDPTNKTDLIEYRYFLEENSWKTGCPFILEWPYLNVVEMIQSKLVGQYLNKIISTAK